jgi:hypothetical protein
MNDPNEALESLFQPAQLKTNLFPPNSRYAGLGTKLLETASDRAIIFLQRRFVPSPNNFAVLHEHVVTEGERLDNVTARYLGDPEQFWRVCDPNAAMRPQELMETIGRRLRITLPEGIPGAPDA